MKTSVVFTYNHQAGVAKNTLHPQADANVKLAIRAIEKANEIYFDVVKTILINVQQSGLTSDGFSPHATLKVSLAMVSDFTDKVARFHPSTNVRLYSANLDSDTGVLFPKNYTPNTHVTRSGVYVNEVSGRKLVSKDAIEKNVLKSWAGYIIGQIAYTLRGYERQLEEQRLENLAKQVWSSRIENYVDVTLAQMKVEVATSLGIEEDELDTCNVSKYPGTLEAELLIVHKSNDVRVGLRKMVFGCHRTGALRPEDAKWELTASQDVTKKALAKVAGLSIL